MSDLDERMAKVCRQIAMFNRIRLDAEAKIRALDQQMLALLDEQRAIAAQKEHSDGNSREG